MKMGYERLPGEPDAWAYDGLRIQADVATHRFTVQYASGHVPRGGRVLDVGAGTGALAKQLLDAGYTVACTSWDGKVAVHAPVYKLDLDLPFSTSDVGGHPYDLVTCLEVIEHVENPSALLRSLRNVVNPEGRVIVSTPNVESAQARLQWLLRGRPLIFHGNEIVRNRHISMMWREGLEFLVAEAGFAIESRQLIGESRIKGTVQALVKKPLYAAMSKLLKGDTHGETRLYTLRPTERPARGRPDVY